MLGPYPQVVIVADDLTGAMDAAAPFARRGLDVRVLTAAVSLEMVHADPPQILSINTATRHTTEKAAADVVSALIRKLARLNPGVLVKKIDSTLRGHVVVETIAAMEASGYGEVVLCPAVPSQGRSLVGGEVYIHDVALRETAIGRDLRSRPPVTPLPELFRSALPGIPVILEDAGNRLAVRSSERESQIRIVDAVSDDHLLTIAGSVIAGRKDTLLVGASGLTEALAETLFGAEKTAVLPVPLPGKTVFVIGSQAPQSIAQMEALVEPPSNAYVINNTGILPWSFNDQQITLLEQQSSSLIVRAPSLSRDADLNSNLIARDLAASTAALLAQTKIGSLVATGGDTALAVLEALEIDSVTVCGEIKPGVVHGLIETRQGPLRLVTKAGGFGDRQLFCTIERYLKTGSLITGKPGVSRG